MTTNQTSMSKPGVGGTYVGDSLVLMPPAAMNVTWREALAFARVVGGQLPTLAELKSISAADLRERFGGPGFYWSRTETEHGLIEAMAFSDGTESNGHLAHVHVDQRGRALIVHRL